MPFRPTSALLALGAALLSVAVSARIVDINVASVKPFADGAAFGDAGKYERVTGTSVPDCKMKARRTVVLRGAF